MGGGGNGQGIVLACEVWLCFWWRTKAEENDGTTDRNRGLGPPVEQNKIKDEIKESEECGYVSNL